MKIAYILDAFPVLSETFIVREILELRRSKFEIPVFALADTSMSPRNRIIHPESESLRREVRYATALRNRFSRLRQVILHLLFFSRNPIKYFYLLRLCKGCTKRTFHLFRRSVLYAKLFQQEQVQHIHVHFSLHSCTLAMLISAWTSIPFSFTAHAHDIFIPDLAELMEEKIKRACFIVSISEYNKNHLLKKHPWVEESKIRVFHCGIDIERFSPGIRRKNQVFKMLAVGRLTEKKGFKYLIQACELLKKKHGLAFVCDIVGDGEERLKLEEIIREADLHEEIYLRGARDQEGVRKALESTDAFVLPCVAANDGAMDGIPVVLMEAMSMEVPVITTRISGIPELVSHGAGILVEPEDVNGLAAASQKLASLSDLERREVGRRGRAIIESQFNLKIEVGKLAELFRSSSRRF